MEFIKKFAPIHAFPRSKQMKYGEFNILSTIPIRLLNKKQNTNSITKV